MTDRILDFAEEPAWLKVRLRQLVIERKGQPEVSLPLSEVAALILAHPQALCSQPVLAGLMEQGAAVVVCDGKNLPVGMMLPLAGHGFQTRRLIAQAAAPLPLKKRLWKNIIEAKIKAQADLLVELRRDDHGLLALAKSVRSGDPGNREAQASKRYWAALFDDPEFRRRHEAEDQNRFLNYGYAVLRAVVGRAICGAGLHPSLGVHHHNRENPFCLCDDLMEPYRPLVDSAVVELVGVQGKDGPLDRAGKQVLIEAILKRYDADGEARTLFDLAARTATSLAKVYLKESESLYFPKKLGDAST